MIFSSLVFLFLYLPFVLIIYLLLVKKELRNLFLVAASLFFYAWGKARMYLQLHIEVVHQEICILKEGEQNSIEQATIQLKLIRASAANPQTGTTTWSICSTHTRSVSYDFKLRKFLDKKQWC